MRTPVITKGCSRPQLGLSGRVDEMRRRPAPGLGAIPPPPGVPHLPVVRRERARGAAALDGRPALAREVVAPENRLVELVVVDVCQGQVEADQPCARGGAHGRFRASRMGCVQEKQSARRSRLALRRACRLSAAHPAASGYHQCPLHATPGSCAHLTRPACLPGRPGGRLRGRCSPWQTTCMEEGSGAARDRF
jgi:hypothetical protein